MRMPRIKDMLPLDAGRRLVEARCALGLTTKEMADKLGLKSYQYGAYEREERAINGKVLANLRDTSINIDYIRTGEGELRKAPLFAELQTEIGELSDDERRMVMAFIKALRTR